MHPSPVLYDHARDERDADAEAIAAIAAELAEGDEIVDIAGSLSDDEHAQFDVALCRWYRGEKNALEAVRGIFDQHLTNRARLQLLREREASKRDVAEARDWSRAA